MGLIDMLDAYFLKKMENKDKENGEKEKEERIGLTTLPMLAFKEIIGKLDFQSVQNIRATCKTLRKRTPYPHEKITSIQINIKSDCTAVFLHTSDKSYVMTVPQSENCWESLLLFDWDLIFHKRTTPLRKFSIWYNRYYDDPQFSFVYKFFRLILKSRPPLLVKNLFLSASDQDDVLSILQFCDSKHLKSIKLDGDIGANFDEDKVFHLNKLYDLEQWKNAEEFELWDVRDFAENDLNPDLAPFAHFLYLSIPWSEVQEDRGRRRG
ncbi:hypothetical protein CAEBREN_02630 [Caenorhabditis brenneri]|uniref:Uncharacterized protein n=1 Tax=Caenorhabditis brenneri TaxID=135651 RepID=G0N1G2_CAEBE|nr:hypothetical protein CAEBREN_02630 [Caenorhabditis brenneri]